MRIFKNIFNWRIIRFKFLTSLHNSDDLRLLSFYLFIFLEIIWPCQLISFVICLLTAF